MGWKNEAIEIYQMNVQIRKDTLGPKHPETLISSFNLATTIYENGNYSDALRILEEVWDSQKEIIGENAKDTLNTLRMIINCKYELKQYKETEQMILHYLPLFDQMLDEEHVWSKDMVKVLLFIHTEQNERAKAE